MYPRNVTERIIELQAKGFSAEETREVLAKDGFSMHLNTVYAHRKSSVGQEITDELIRQQQRDILRQQQSNPELALKYRNELIKVLAPIKAEILSKSVSINKTSVEVNVAGLLAEYEDILEGTVVSSNGVAKQVCASQANAQASAIPITR